ncbi:MAG: type II toxin-antitoxin system PemK/MazF family toxin [Oricola sp.]|nr:type II toxin-antitoxin system PemK/MazF family toxin [Oricola sp.]
MALKFHPEPGALLVCDYGDEPIEPEMVKRRPVVVVSPRLKHRDGLCCVVALSTTPPKHVCEFHHKIVMDRPLPPPFDAREMWVKGDMIATVGFHRLDLVRTGRDQTGKRKYLNIKIKHDDLLAVHQAVLHGLGLGILTPHMGS